MHHNTTIFMYKETCRFEKQRCDILTYLQSIFYPPSQQFSHNPFQACLVCFVSSGWLSSPLPYRCLQFDWHTLQAVNKISFNHTNWHSYPMHTSFPMQWNLIFLGHYWGPEKWLFTDQIIKVSYFSRKYLD